MEISECVLSKNNNNDIHYIAINNLNNGWRFAELESYQYKMKCWVLLLSIHGCSAKEGSQGWGKGCRFLISVASCRTISAIWQKKKAGSLRVHGANRNKNFVRKKSSVKPYSGKYSPYRNLGRKISHLLSLTLSYSQDAHMWQAHLAVPLQEGDLTYLLSHNCQPLHLVPLVKQPWAV